MIVADVKGTDDIDVFAEALQAVVDVLGLVLLRADAENRRSRAAHLGRDGA